MSRLTKQQYFMKLAEVVAERATCPKKAVGCVLVSSRDYIVATGYNGALAGHPHCIDVFCGGSPCIARHAEFNACSQLYLSDETPEYLRPRVAYCTYSPCKQCFDALIKIGILHIVFKEQSKYNELPNWCQQYGVRLTKL